jgi:hypothetical protein
MKRKRWIQRRGWPVSAKAARKAKMKEQTQQLQSQVADPASVFVCICISSLLIASAALASRGPTAWRTQWLRCK